MNQPDFNGARQYVVERLSNELPPGVRYHTRAHTEEIVAPATDHLAGLLNIQGVPLLLLRTGAYFHDMGFVVQTVNHEEIGASIAEKVLPDYGYDRQQIEAVRNLIMATKLPQSPHNLLEQILADADLDILGRADFMPWNQKLREEIEAYGKPLTDDQWLSGQIRFMSEHRYWTEAARNLRDTQKRANIQSLVTMQLRAKVLST